MTIKRIASLFALTAAIAAVPAVAPSTFASISPTAAYASCWFDGAQVPCSPGPGDNCEPNCGVGKPCGSSSIVVFACEFPLSDVPRERLDSQTSPTRDRPRGRG